MSPPTSTLSYIFPAKIRGPGGEVLRAASLTQMTTPSEEKSWGRGARPRPPPRLATRARGRPLPKVPRLSRPAAPPVPGEKPGSCVCWGRRGPSTPPPERPAEARELRGFTSRGLTSGVSWCPRQSPAAPQVLRPGAGSALAGRGSRSTSSSPPGLPGFSWARTPGGGGDPARPRLLQAGRWGSDDARCWPPPPASVPLPCGPTPFPPPRPV